MGYPWLTNFRLLECSGIASYLRNVNEIQIELASYFIKRPRNHCRRNLVYFKSCRDELPAYRSEESFCGLWSVVWDRNFPAYQHFLASHFNTVKNRGNAVTCLRGCGTVECISVKSVMKSIRCRENMINMNKSFQRRERESGQWWSESSDK